MDIFSCRKCGVMVDRGRIEFPEVYDEDGDLIEGRNRRWVGGLKRFVPIVQCPVCRGAIPEVG